MKVVKGFLEIMEQTFTIYGFAVIFIVIIAVLFGEDAQDISTMFSLGKQGIGVATLVQYFALSMMISILKTILFADGIIKGLSGTIRIILMFIGVVLSVVIFIIAFEWFPVDNFLAWMMFFLNFLVCVVVSVSISSVKDRIDNKKLDEALQRLKRGEDNE